ncbi:hypothetical protein ABH892_001802 [Paenibacillus sp. RC254]
MDYYDLIAELAACLYFLQAYLDLECTFDNQSLSKIVFYNFIIIFTYYYKQLSLHVEHKKNDLSPLDRSVIVFFVAWDIFQNIAQAMSLTCKFF